MTNPEQDLATARFRRLVWMHRPEPSPEVPGEPEPAPPPDPTAPDPAPPEIDEPVPTEIPPPIKEPPAAPPIRLSA